MIGVQVVDEGAPCDATLTFTETLRAIGADYRGVGRLYTDTNARGQLELTGEGRPAFSVPVSRRLDRPSSVNYTPGNRRFALFGAVWPPALLDGLFELWGAQVYIAVWKDENSAVRWRAAEVLGEIGDPRAVEPLIALLKKRIRGRIYAAEALDKLG